MKKSVFVFLLIFLTNHSFAQKQGTELIDSLKTKLLSSSEDTSKVRLMGQLSFQYFKFDTDSGIYFAQEAVQLAEKLQWGLGVAFSYNYMGTNYAVRGNHPKALECFNKSLSKYSEIGDKQGVAFLSNNLGNFYRMLKDYTKAIDFCNRAVTINTELKNPPEMAKNYNNLGYIYSTLGDYSKSNDYYYKGLKIQQANNNKPLIAQLLINIAENKMKQRDYRGSLELCFDAIKISKELNSPYDRSVYMSLVGEVYLRIAGDSSIVKNNCRYYSNNKRENLLFAEKYLTASLSLLDNIHDLSEISGTSLLLSRAYEKMGDANKALLFYKKYSENKDSVFSKDNSITIANIEKKQEVELRDHKIKIQSLEIAKKNSRNLSQIVLFILVIILMSILYFALNRKQKRQRALIAEAEKEAANKALRESEERFRNLYEDAPIGLYRTTPDGKILLSNQALIKMLGFSSFEEISAVSLEQTDSDSLYQRKQFLEQIERDGEVKDIEAKWICADGKAIIVKENAKVIRDSNGKTLYYDGTVEDITEKKQILDELIQSKEKTELSNKLKDAFIANISHEIRTPLNGIIGMTCIIQDSFSQYAAKEEERIFTSIGISSRRLMNTMDKVLNFSRLQVREFPVRKTYVTLSSIIQTLLKLYNPMAASKSLKICYNSSIDNDTVFADPATLNTAFEYLIENAIKFTNEGAVDISLYQDEQSNKCIAVSDTGIGISEEYLPRLFESYSQEMIGYSRPYEGLGLGLAISKKLLDLNGASIVVKSKKGEGTVFTICFDKQMAQQAEYNQGTLEKIQVQSPSLSKVPAKERLAILVVEDDEENQFFIESILKKEYIVKMALNAEDALKLLKTRSFDVILMDISLKYGMNGLELTKVIRSGKENPNIPIVAVTGHAFPEDQRQAMEAGCNDYLAKPFQSHQLLEKVRDLLVVNTIKMKD